MSSISFSTPGLGRIWSTCLTVFLLLLVDGARAQLNNKTSPTSQFKSRPDLHPPIITFDVLKPDLVTPGYVFLAPYRNVDPGPYIYDNAGNLVWSGAGSSGPKTAHTPRVCQYKGEDHLCYFQGEQHQGFARGHGVIMNKHYQIVRTVESSGAGASSDMHEFKMTPYSDGTTALMTVYQPRQYDLTTNPRFNVVKGMGWVVEGVFQEVEIETGKVIFEWRSLDHVDPGLSWTMPGTTDTSGDGLGEKSPWDYFHLNSIDKNKEGDYLLSARHVSALYKISGKDGHIMWEMGGNNPTFEQTNFNFSYQHHARWISENSTHTVLSFYDNASNTFNSTGEFSHGWIIEIDHSNSTASVVKEWGAPEPEGGLLSGSQGNMQLLSSGNVHIGWGEHPWFSEHTADGEAVMYGKLAERASNVMIYRSNKYNWTAQPLTKPALWTYSREGKDKMASFASWNGATDVASWNFYHSDSSEGPWHLAGNATKTGFETEWHTPTLAPWSYAQALDVKGHALASSVIARTFIPSDSLRDHCDDRGCSKPEHAKDETPYEASTSVPAAYLSPNRGFDTSHYYATLPGEKSTSNAAKSDKYTGSGKTYSSFGFFTVLGVFTFLVLVIGGLGVAVFVAWKRGAFGQAKEAWHEGKNLFPLQGADKFDKGRGAYGRIREMEGSESASSGSNSGDGSKEGHGSGRGGQGEGDADAGADAR
ncbi:hypothetical protein MBLNU230_g7829t1 [Neophaeotheca triangularis]